MCRADDGAGGAAPGDTPHRRDLREPGGTNERRIWAGHLGTDVPRGDPAHRWAGSRTSLAKRPY